MNNNPTGADGEPNQLMPDIPAVTEVFADDHGYQPGTTAALDSARQALTRITRLARALAEQDPALGDVIAAAVLGVDPRDCLPGAALALLEGTYD